MRIWAGVALVLVLAGCVRSAQNDEPPTPAQPTRADVPWGNYDASVKTRIDALDDGNDCLGLQAEFDTAYANDDATRERTGTGNSLLMSYIDEALRESGCY